MVLIALVGGSRAAAAERASLSYSPVPARAGEYIEVTGTGQCPGLGDPDTGQVDMLVGFTYATGVRVRAQDGTFAARVQTPGDAGSYTLTSWCNPGRGDLTHVEASVAVPVVDPADGVSITVSPERARPGDDVGVTAGNLYASCSAMSLTLDDVLVDTAWSNGSDGTVTGSFTLGPDVAVGSHQVEVGCDRKAAPDLAFEPASITVDVRPPAPPDPDTSSTTSSVTTTTTTTTSSVTTTTTASVVMPGTSTSTGSLPSARAAPSATAPEAAADPAKRAALATWLRPPSDPGLLDAQRALVCLGLAVLLMLLIGFPAQLFESTFEQNEARITAALTRGRRRGPRRALPRPPRWVGFIGFVIFATVLYGLTDPNFGRDLQQTMLDAVGFAVALPLVTLAFEVPAELYSRRVGRQRSHLRTVPAAMVIAVACAALSFAGNFQPGYIYGLIAGFATLKSRTLSRDEEARAVLLGAAVIATIVLVCWVVWDSLDTVLATGSAGIGRHVADAVLATTVVVGVQALAFQLLPLTFMDGHSIVVWNKAWWRGIYTLAVFALLFVAFSPRTRNDTLDVQVTGMIVLFAAFGLASLAFWASFRYTPESRSARAPRR